MKTFQVDACAKRFEVKGRSEVISSQAVPKKISSEGFKSSCWGFHEFTSFGAIQLFGLPSFLLLPEGIPGVAWAGTRILEQR